MGDKRERKPKRKVQEIVLEFFENEDYSSARTMLILVQSAMRKRAKRETAKVAEFYADKEKEPTQPNIDM